MPDCAQRTHAPHRLLHLARRVGRRDEHDAVVGLAAVGAGLQRGQGRAGRCGSASASACDAARRGPVDEALHRRRCLAVGARQQHRDRELGAQRVERGQQQRRGIPDAVDEQPVGAERRRIGDGQAVLAGEEARAAPLVVGVQRCERGELARRVGLRRRPPPRTSRRRRPRCAARAACAAAPTGSPASPRPARSSRRTPAPPGGRGCDRRGTAAACARRARAGDGRAAGPSSPTVMRRTLRCAPVSSASRRRRCGRISVPPTTIGSGASGSRARCACTSSAR